MYLSVAIAAENAPTDAFVVWRGFEQSIQKAARMGYHGVELALKDASEVDADALSRALEQNHMAVSCITTGQVYAVRHLYFTHPDERMRQQAVKAFTGLITLAKRFDAPVNIGRARGFRAAGQSEAQTRALFCQSARRVLDMADRAGVTLLLEPANRYEINFINTLDEAAALCAQLDDRLLLMPDVFHMNIEDARIGDSLRRNGARIGYVHLADSNRLSPGKGHLDFDEIFDALKAAGYDGWASVEILPRPDPDTAAAEAARFLLPYIDRHNAR